MWNEERIIMRGQCAEMQEKERRKIRVKSKKLNRSRGRRKWRTERVTNRNDRWKRYIESEIREKDG